MYISSKKNQNEVEDKIKEYQKKRTDTLIRQYHNCLESYLKIP